MPISRGDPEDIIGIELGVGKCNENQINKLNNYNPEQCSPIETKYEPHM